MKILINTNVRSSRMAYVCDFIFHQSLGLEWLFDEREALQRTIRIGLESHSGYISIPDSGLLAESKIIKSRRPVIVDAIKRLSSKPDEGWTHVDLFAVVFYMLSRYDEYIDQSRDQHDRFMAQSSCLHEIGLIETPLVDQIIFLIRELITKQFSQNLTLPATKLISTIDVDLPWYRQNIKWPYYIRKKSFAGQQDPYDTFDQILAHHKEINCDPIFFFLMHDAAPYEKINRYKKGTYKSLISWLKSKTQIGIHPPYRSAVDDKTMSTAIKQYTKLAGMLPTISRQHYLRIKTPTTYRLLLKHHIDTDYSLGFAERVGFRAGTARPFYWYDLKKETQTTLRIIPLVAMDVTLKNYMKLSPEQAFNKLMELKKSVDEYGGNMSILWHNSSLSEIDDWQEFAPVYFEFLETYRLRGGPA